jgi:hypothetical protein
MPSVNVTWHTQKDGAVCPICRAIEGYTWTFVDVVPDSLVHPVYGEVWNIHLGSLAHELHFSTPKASGGTSRVHGLMSNCRCHITSEFNLKDILEALTTLRNSLREAEASK